MAFNLEDFTKEINELLSSKIERGASNPGELYEHIEIIPVEFVMQILLRIWNGCKNGKSLKDVLTDIIDSEGQGTHYNFIPSDKENNLCRYLCIGIATEEMGANKKGKVRVGFDGLMRLAIENWLNCNQINNTTVLITANWDETKFNRDWLSIINTRVKSGKRVLVLQVSKNGEFLIQYPSKY
jgi:hypothetical protein